LELFKGKSRLYKVSDSFSFYTGEEALRTDSLGKIQERISIAVENSADARAREMMTIICRYLAEANMR